MLLKITDRGAQDKNADSKIKKLKQLEKGNRYMRQMMMASLKQDTAGVTNVFCRGPDNRQFGLWSHGVYHKPGAGQTAK